MFPYDQNNQLYQQLLQGIQQNNPISGKQTVTKVTGRAGAEAYQLPPDSSILLLDTTNPIVWLAQTDGAGYKSLIPYDIKVHEEKAPEDKYKSLEDRIAKLEEAINAKQSNTTNVKRKSDTAE